MVKTVTLDKTSVKHWSLEEFYGLYRAGFATKQSELIEGEIIEPMPTSSFHAYLVRFLGSWLRALFGELYVSEEKPLRIEEVNGRESEPLPDLAVHVVPYTALKFRHLLPEETRLIVEISYSTRTYDLERKAPLYARAGIGEYWVVDVQGRQVVVHRDPQDGNYSSVTSYTETEEVSTFLHPEARLSVSELLPPIGMIIE